MDYRRSRAQPHLLCRLQWVRTNSSMLQETLLDTLLFMIFLTEGIACVFFPDILQSILFPTEGIICVFFPVLFSILLHLPNTILACPRRDSYSTLQNPCCGVQESPLKLFLFILFEVAHAYLSIKFVLWLFRILRKSESWVFTPRQDIYSPPTPPHRLREHWGRRSSKGVRDGGEESHVFQAWRDFLQSWVHRGCSNLLLKDPISQWSWMGVARALPHPVETETVTGEIAQWQAANALPKDPSSVSSMHMRVGQLNCL